MTASIKDQLVVALSARALFNFEDENRVFEERDDAAYMAIQLERLDTPADPGCAFPLVKKLLGLNTPEHRRVEVIVVSRNDPVSGLRVFKSAQAHGLDLTRGVFTRGRAAHHYLRPLGAHLFLTTHEDDVRKALLAGYPAAKVFPVSVKEAERHPDEIRIAFDGDAVLFSDEAEQIYQRDGLAAFTAHEHSNASLPLSPGPFKPLLDAIHRLQQANTPESPIKIRTALVTARSAPAHERAVRTLMSWNVSIDEAMFLGGLSKGPFLQEFEPDFFFDDHPKHCESATSAGPVGHVVGGVVNS